jgi:hypothetical protein
MSTAIKRAAGPALHLPAGTSEPPPPSGGRVRRALRGSTAEPLGGGFPGGGPGGDGSQSAIAHWVQAHGKAVTGAGSAAGTLYRVSA